MSQREIADGDGLETTLEIFRREDESASTILAKASEPYVSMARRLLVLPTFPA
jgi:hypothetical protein